MKGSKVSADFIEEVRENVVKLVLHSNEKYDRVDIDRIRNTDEMIKRFIMEYLEANGSHEAITCMSHKVAGNICETLRWRKDFGVNNLKDSDFPIEFYRSGLLSFSSVAAGHEVLVMRVDRLVRLKYWSNLWIKFIVHEVEKMGSVLFLRDDFFDSEPPHVIADSSEIGFAQIDLHFILTVIPIFFKHFPQGVSKVWLYEIPFFSLALKPIVMKTLPSRVAKKVMFADRKIIVKEMGYDRVPVTYGGSPDNTLTHAHPIGGLTLSLKEVGRENNIPDHEIAKMTIELQSSIKKSASFYQ